MAGLFDFLDGTFLDFRSEEEKRANDYKLPVVNQSQSLIQRYQGGGNPNWKSINATPTATNMSFPIVDAQQFNPDQIVSDMPLAPLDSDVQNMSTKGSFDAMDMMGMNTTQGPATETQSQINPPTEEPGFFDKIGSGMSDFFGDEERMARMTIALNSMRLNPDPNIAKSMENKLESLRKGKGKNATVIELRKMGRNDLADAVETGSMKATTAWTLAYREKKSPTAREQNVALWEEDPDKFAKMKEAGVIGGSGTTVNVGDKEDILFTKSGIAQATKLITAGYSANDTLSDLALLRKLGENPILNEVPDIARGFIPTGFSEAIDAYTAVLDRVAKGQRQAGEGVMTEKDFEVLQKTSGDIATSIVSRRVVQTALEEVNKRTAERATYATQYMSQQITLAQFYEKTNALRNRPMFTKEQLKQINSLEGMMGYGILNDNEKNSVSKEQWNKMSMQDREKFINFRSQ